MQPSDPHEPRIARVIDGARELGLDIRPVTFENETRTAQQAATEIGCDVAESCCFFTPPGAMSSGRLDLWMGS
jgi:hypothetical protein